jgi:soluble lytic murein transglycosylase-like protein
MGYIQGFLHITIGLSFGYAQAPLIQFSEPQQIEIDKFGHEREVEEEFLIAESHGVEPQLLKAVLQVESNLDHKAINPQTLDFGIGQINYKTAEALDIDISRLTKDRAYSIERAAFILSTFQKRYAKREPQTWVCRYNVGTAPTLSKKQKELCNHYLRKVKIAYGPKEI